MFKTLLNLYIADFQQLSLNICTILRLRIIPNRKLHLNSSQIACNVAVYTVCALNKTQIFHVKNSAYLESLLATKVATAVFCEMKLQ